MPSLLWSSTAMSVSSKLPHQEANAREVEGVGKKAQMGSSIGSKVVEKKLPNPLMAVVTKPADEMAVESDEAKARSESHRESSEDGPFVLHREMREKDAKIEAMAPRD